MKTKERKNLKDKFKNAPEEQEPSIVELLGNDFELVVSILSKDVRALAIQGLKNKNINNQTCAEVLRYLTYNSQAFGQILDTREVTQRIVSNLNHSIGFLKASQARHGVVGGWAPESGSILLSKRFSREELFAIGKKAKAKKRCAYKSCIYHELDHCATANKDNMPSKEQYEKWYEKYIKDQSYYEEVDDVLHKMCTGIANCRSLIQSDLNIEFLSALNYLNEGITVYKQRKYDKIAFGKEVPLYGDYAFYADMATHLANVIGEEKMLVYQNQGNYGAMRKEYSGKTAKDLNWLLTEIYLYMRTIDYHDRYYHREDVRGQMTTIQRYMKEKQIDEELQK